MFICKIWFFSWYFPQFCTSDISKYGYLEAFQRVPSTSRQRESTVVLTLLHSERAKLYTILGFLCAIGLK